MPNHTERIDQEIERINSLIPHATSNTLGYLAEQRSALERIKSGDAGISEHTETQKSWCLWELFKSLTGLR